PCKVTGRCGSVLERLIRAPRGTGVVSAPVPKKLPMMASIDLCYTSARGCTDTLGNFARATFDAISKTYSSLTPDLWTETVFTKNSLTLLSRPTPEFLCRGPGSSCGHHIILYKKNKISLPLTKCLKRSV
uniref:Small ribosomal subunit protein uS5 n=1 Tax=Myotis lucifugus TaxID=59463 RepID=G1QBV2_MYOLU